jgi:hypothetical protein
VDLTEPEARVFRLVCRGHCHDGVADVIPMATVVLPVATVRTVALEKIGKD